MIPFTQNSGAGGGNVVNPTQTATPAPVDPLGNTTPVPTGVSTTSSYNPPPRNAWVNGVWTQSYAGPGIVDSRNNLVMGADGNPYEYDLNRDPSVEFFGMSEDKRAATLERLELRGFPTRTPDQAISSLAWLMATGNEIGRDWETALREVERTTPEQVEQASVARYSITSQKDVASIADRVAQQTLGRKFSADELNRFVQSYQQQELQYQQQMQVGGVVEQAPGVDVAAESFAQQIAPTEANAYKYLGYVDQLFSSLGSRL